MVKLDKPSKTQRQKFWAGQIGSNLKIEQDKWRNRAKKVVKRYRDDTERNGSQFNILWSNTEILKAATFSRTPEPNVARRFNDVVGDDGSVPRRASEVLERCLEFYKDEEGFTNNLRKARDDMLLPGRGVVWVQYNAEFEKIQLETIELALDEGVDEEQEVTRVFMMDGVVREPDGFAQVEGVEVAFVEELSIEEVVLDYVYWEDFLHSNSRSWEDVWWVARKHALDQKELVDMFGEEVLTKIDLTGEDERDSEEIKRSVFTVWEIWDKARRERVWYTEKAFDILEVEEPPLELTDFFPCPKPIMPFETTDTMLPVPEFCIYQDQARELDNITCRLGRLTEALKAAGLYNGKNSQHIIDLKDAADGQLLPVNLTEFGTDGSLSQQIQYLPLSEIAAVIDKLEARKIVLKNEIFELTGISDVVRGDSNPNETATAQRLKGSFGSLRLRPRREPMEELIRDVYRIMSEVIADKFDVETMQMITGVQIPPEVAAFMKDDTLRNFRIDVETDSTVQPNQEIDKARATEFATAMGTFMAQAVQAVESQPALAPIAGETIKFLAQQFKAGRTLEGLIDETVDRLTKQATQQTQQQDPAAQAALMEQQTEQLKLRVEQQKLQIESQKLQLQARQQNIDLTTLQQEAVITQQNNQTDLLQDQIRSGAQITTARIEQETSQQDNQTKILTEQIKSTQNTVQ